MVSDFSRVSRVERARVDSREPPQQASHRFLRLCIVMLYVKLLRLTLLTAQKAFQRNTKDVLGLQDIGFIRND